MCKKYEMRMYYEPGKGMRNSCQWRQSIFWGRGEILFLTGRGTKLRGQSPRLEEPRRYGSWGGTTNPCPLPPARVSGAGFSIYLNFQDVMTSELKNLDVNVQNLEVVQ